MLKEIRRYMNWFWKTSKGMKGLLALNALLNILHVAVSLYFVFICKRLIDIATGAAEGEIPLWSAVMICDIAAQITLSWLKLHIAAQNDIRLKNRLRLELFSQLIHVYHGGRKEKHTGDLMNRLEEDVRIISETTCNTLPALLSTTLQFLAAFSFLIALNPDLAWTVVGIMPLALLLGKVFFKRMRRLTRDIRNTDSQVQSHLQENLQHATLIQTLEQGERVSGHLSRLQNGLYEQVMKKTRFSLFSRTLVTIAFAGGYAVAFIWGVHGISEGLITFGTMTAFLQLVGQIQRPMVEMSSHIPAIAHAMASADRLEEIEGNEDPDICPEHLSSPAGIRIEHLTFSYPDGKRKILRNFSYDFTPGSRTAILGETGAGKSTLIRLILALLKPQEGNISLYDGSRSVTASSATRCNLVYVPQGNSLLSGTVRENLLLGDPQASEEEMGKVLGIAEAQFVFDLPQGLDTPCSEKGGGLSEGQAQRIAIARALLRKGSILLLDEFSSSLDPETETRLMNNLTASLSDRTMIFITHRKMITAFCDRIVEIIPEKKRPA